MPEYGDDLLRGGLGPAEQLQHAVLHGGEAACPAAQGDLVPAHDITVNLRWSLLSQCNISFEALVITDLVHRHQLVLLHTGALVELQLVGVCVLVQD